MIRLTIHGQPYSKANSRILRQIKGRTVPIKSKVAQQYVADALRQIPPAARQRIDGPVSATIHIYYATERPDLDESLLLDILQDQHKGAGEARVLVQAGVYRNDRQVRERHVYHHIDKANPRAEIVIEPRMERI